MSHRFHDQFYKNVLPWSMFALGCSSKKSIKLFSSLTSCDESRWVKGRAAYVHAFKYRFEMERGVWCALVSSAKDFGEVPSLNQLVVMVTELHGTFLRNLVVTIMELDGIFLRNYYLDSSDYYQNNRWMNWDRSKYHQILFPQKVLSFRWS